MNLTLLGETVVNSQENKSPKAKQTTQTQVLVTVTVSICSFQLEPAGSARDTWLFSPEREESSQGIKYHPIWGSLGWAWTAPETQSGGSD